MNKRGRNTVARAEAWIYLVNKRALGGRGGGVKREVVTKRERHEDDEKEMREVTTKGRVGGGR